MMEPSDTPAPLHSTTGPVHPTATSDTQSSSPVDNSFSMDDHQESKKSRGSKPKLFQCTGYGDCRMVFTRSEHLARHMRKHTGEKPFKCVVPGCSRMFSRFDNMMQHTQTHNKSRATPRRPKGTGKTKVGASEQSFSDADSSYDHNGLPSPPPSRRGSEHGKLVSNKPRIRRHHRQLQRKNYAEDDEDDELEYDPSQDELFHHDDPSPADSDSDNNSYHMYHHHHHHYQHQDDSGDGSDGPSIISQQRAMFAEMRRSSRDGYALPPLVSHHYSSYGWPTSKTMVEYESIWPPPPPPPPSSIQAPIPLIPSTSSSSYRQQHHHAESPMSSSSSTSTADSLSHSTSCRRPRTTPKVQFHPYPSKHRRHTTTGDNRYVLRPLYPKETQENDGYDKNNNNNDDDDDTRMILPKLATYLVAHPDEPPENYLLHHQLVYDPTTTTTAKTNEPLAQKRALTWPTLPGTEKAITRRLSVQDLCNPIECLEPSSPLSSSTTATTIKDGGMMELETQDDTTNAAGTAPMKPEEGIDLTLDEYEAIQGFGRFQKFGALK